MSKTLRLLLLAAALSAPAMISLPAGAAGPGATYQEVAQSRPAPQAGQRQRQRRPSAQAQRRHREAAQHRRRPRAAQG